MPAFSSYLTNVKKLKNTAPKAKGDIRRNVLASVKNPRVFDAFAGDGEMFDAAWKDADYYVGCDMEWPRDDRLIYVGDNRRIMRNLDLSGFNIFDFDAYGSPWDQLWIFVHRRRVQPGETIGLVMTEGSSLKARSGGLSNAMAQFAGIVSDAPGMGSNLDFAIDRAISNMLRMMNVDPVQVWKAHSKTKAQLRHFGMILVGK